MSTVPSRAQQILDFVRMQREPMIALLCDLVQSESPSSNPESHRTIRSILKSQLGSVDFIALETAAKSGVRHIYARPLNRTRGAPLQLLLGHLDTVWPLGTLSKRPFSVEGNIARGPGVFDMKGGLAQIIVALQALKALDLSPPLTPVVFVNADEEIGSRTSTRFIRCLARRAERAFVMEPALGNRGYIKTKRKGVGRFTITVFGKPAHAGLDPEGGASAILELSHVIQKVFALNDPENGISVNVGTVDGGVQPNVIAPHSKAIIDVRVPALEDGDRIERAIHGIQPETRGVRLRIEGRIGRPPMEGTPRNLTLWRQAQQAGLSLGLELQAATAGGGSDGNTTSQFTATLDGLGPVGDGAHAEHELLYIDKTLERAALLAMLMLGPSAAQTQKASGS